MPDLWDGDRGHTPLALGGGKGLERLGDLLPPIPSFYKYVQLAISNNGVHNLLIQRDTYNIHISISNKHGGMSSIFFSFFLTLEKNEYVSHTLHWILTI